MTTKPVHKYTIITDIDYSALEFNPDAPEPLPDGMFQFPMYSKKSTPFWVHYLDTLGDAADHLSQQQYLHLLRP